MIFELELLLGLAWRKKKHNQSEFSAFRVFIICRFVSIWWVKTFSTNFYSLFLCCVVTPLFLIKRWLNASIFNDLVLLLIVFRLLSFIVLLYHYSGLKGCWTAANMLIPLVVGRYLISGFRSCCLSYLVFVYLFFCTCIRLLVFSFDLFYIC